MLERLVAPGARARLASVIVRISEDLDHSCSPAARVPLLVIAVSKYAHEPNPRFLPKIDAAV